MHVSVKEIHLTPDIVAIRVIGPIDAPAAARLEQTLVSLLESNCYDIICDLGDVQYICSTGWSLFVNNLKEIRDHGGDLKLARMNWNVYEIYRKAG